MAPRGERLALPDCSREGDPYFALTAEEKRELVLRIARDGPDAIDAYVREKEAAGDGAIAARLRRLREELLKRAEELKRRLEGGYSEERREAEARYAEAYAELEEQRAARAAELERLRASEASFLEDALRGSELVNLVLSAPPPDRLGAWARARRFLRRLLRVLLAPLRWLLGLLFGRKARRVDRITIAAPVGGRLGVEVEARAGDAYLANPELRRRVKERLRAAPPRERVRRAWERLLGREDYESIARRVARDMLEEEARARRSEIAARERTISDAIQRLAEEEESRRAELEGRLRDLERAREIEAARIEREMAAAPERDLKEEILDELKGTGLLRERGGRLLPTLQFLDRFGALVYEQESRAGAGRESSTGAYAEGEGTFQREPLRSHIEIAHMDVVASKLRARMRHPKVPHLLEEDVLVYREEREALQHVVVILDRSGSMEEHGRMDAGKRAALALHHAVKSENRRNRVDFVEMSTSVRRVDAFGVWEAEPRGFTNTGAALRLAADLLKDAKSERGLVYLVTDGLPEAYTVEGEDVAGHPEKARKFAVEAAKRLRAVPGFGSFVCLLLEPEDEMFVTAAGEIAKVLDGRVVKVSPKDLAGQLIRAHAADQATPALPTRRAR